MTDYMQSYFALAAETLKRIEEESGPAMRQAAELIADSLAAGGVLMLFGSGHSALIAKDAAYRAGGLAPAVAIDDIADGDLERLEGAAYYILSRYELRPGNVLVVISNSGINPVPIEMVLLAQQAGLKVIAITSFAHSRSVPPRHSSGKRLYEVADIAIDTCGVPGDAGIALAGSTLKTGALSTLAGSSIVQAITVQVAGLLAERGQTPPIWISANVPDGDAHNDSLLEQYRSRLVRYQMAMLSKSGRR